MLSKTLGVLDLAETLSDIHYYSGCSIDSIKGPAVLLLVSPITLAYMGYCRNAPYTNESVNRLPLLYEPYINALRTWSPRTLLFMFTISLSFQIPMMNM